MRSIASCYNEHAIKVSDSYCSGPSNQPYISPKFALSSPNIVKCTYKAKTPSQKNFLITLTWCNNPLGHGRGLTINVGETRSKFDPNSHRLTKNKGRKTFKACCNSEIEVIWDVSNAKYINGPEPSTKFSIIVLVDTQLCLSLGDMDDDDHTSRIHEEQQKATVPEFSLISRSEVFLATTSHVYSTKARFRDDGSAHDIVIECNEEDEKRNRVLSVIVDEKKMFQVKRLKWNFRGNQIIFLDGLLIDVMWDLHDWLFNQTSSGRVVFMFRTRSGLDCRLWLEEKNSKFEQENVGRGEFSLLICACKNLD